MTIEKNKVVKLSYNLHAGIKGEEKQFIERTNPADPFVFLAGAGGLVVAFENNLLGLKANDKFDFFISAEDAYGAFDMEAIVSVPKEIFKVNGSIDENMLQVGKQIPMSDEQGNHITGKVLEVGNTDVRMDFNHPLAGKELHFTGEILSVRQATPEELDHGHAHEGPHHHHH